MLSPPSESRQMPQLHRALHDPSSLGAAGPCPRPTAGVVVTAGHARLLDLTPAEASFSSSSGVAAQLASRASFSALGVAGSAV